MSEPTSDLLERSPEAGARLVALELLDSAAKHARELERGKGDEPLHDFRTALRRTRSWLQAWTQVIGPEAEKFQRKLKSIADQTGAGRDAEVQLLLLRSEMKSLNGAQRTLAVRLEQQLKQQCEEGYAAAREALPKFSRVRSRVRRMLREYQTELRDSGGPRRTFAQAAAEVLRTLAEDFSGTLAEVQSKEDVRALHKSRIRSKRLRYALEPLRGHVPEAEALVARVKELQDVLGDIHDLHVWRERLNAPAYETLRARCEERLTRLYASFAREWLSGGVLDLFAELNAFADRLTGEEADHGAPPTEIERKYLLSSLPEQAKRAPVKEIWQGWIPGEKLHERLRRVKQNGKERYFRTLKLGSGVKRIEVEEEPPRELFEKLWPLTHGRRVMKRRYMVRAGERTWEIDEFTDRRLVLAEIELESEDEHVDIPDWLEPALVREVTGEDAYVNLNLAR